MLQQACQPVPASLRRVDVALAPFWHTRALTLLLLTVAITGTALDSAAAPVAPSSLAQSYLALLLVNLGLAFYAARLGLQSSVFWQLVGRSEPGRWRPALAWAIALSVLILGAESALQLWLGMPESVAARSLLPRLASEKASWVLLAFVVGATEELVYRGYLRQQLQALSGSVALAVLLQGLLFGIAHGSQGAWAVARFAAYGVALGCVAQRERSIVPCVLCHVGLDMYAGLVT